MSLLVLVFITLSGRAQTPAHELRPYLSGLSVPVFMTSSGDGTGRLFVVQQTGQILVVQPGSTSPTTFLNISTRILYSSGGERGLLGLAFHPGYSQNRRFFVYYTRAGDGAIQIGEFAASAANPNIADTSIPEKVIITVPHPSFSNHNGGTVLFGPDGYLYAGLGDGGSSNDPNNNAQNVNVLLGKMIRLDINVASGQVPAYNIPPTNPYAGTIPGADEIYVIGLRNPYRFSFDNVKPRVRTPGVRAARLWLADVGQGLREEVDVIRVGGNYGWRWWEGNRCNTSINVTNPCTAPYDPPVFEYLHSAGRCSITGGNVYRGRQQTVAPGTYIFGDYCTGEIFTWNGTAQTMILDTPRNISAFAVDDTGEIYVVGLGGTIERLARIGAAVSTDADVVPGLWKQ